MKLIASAKINWNLKVAGCRESDGYHLLDSTMIFTKWGDDIIIKPSGEFRLTADGPYAHIFTNDLLATNRGASNLIVKAVYMMADKANKNPDFHIHVTKNIPAGAGLGGGSSDAAAVMHALNDYWELGLSMGELCAMGLTLGAELPVCLHAPQSCRVSGIGDIIEPTDIPSMNLLIVWPDVSLLTKDVFEAYAQSPVTGDVNDLAKSAILLCPEIGDLISQLSECDGCESASMSGSGSACFGIFGTIEQAKNAQSKFKNAVSTTTHTQA